MSFAPLDEHTSRWKDGFSDKVNNMLGPLSRYQQNSPRPVGSLGNPRTWKRRTKIGAIVGSAVVIMVVIVVAVVEARVNAYPSYTKLNYQIKATCE